jgi:serine/threonine protein kinase
LSVVVTLAWIAGRLRSLALLVRDWLRRRLQALAQIASVPVGELPVGATPLPAAQPRSAPARGTRSYGSASFFRTFARAVEPRVEDLTGRVLSHRYEVKRLIASGGMAQVYEAVHVITRRAGALKLLQPRHASSPDAVERLIREASAAARIANPHIVDTLDAGLLESGEPYVFMELLLGDSLDRVLAKRGRFPMLEALGLIVQAANGLAAAHAADVLHRDIKPANLFLLSEPRNFVKLLDFGVSKFSSVDLRTLTKEGRALGTFAYMPPEQMMAAKRVDARADVFSLGVVLYECVAGKRPFVADSVPALHQRMRNNQYTPLRDVIPYAPYDIDAFLARALRADPRERHASMREFHDELDQLHQLHVLKRTLVGPHGAPDRDVYQPTVTPEPGQAPNPTYDKLLARDTIIPVTRKRHLFEK